MLSAELSSFFNLVSRELYICEVYANFEQKIEDLEYGQTVVISGTPGIGKSCLGIYLFIKAIQKQQPVAIRIYKKTYIFLEDRALFGGGSEHKLQAGANKILYLYDCERDDIVPYAPYRNCKLVVFSSPDFNKYKDMVNKKHAEVLYMPVWTENELLVVAASLAITSSVVKQRFERFGGVPRYVFHLELKSVEQLQLYAIYNFSKALDELRTNVFSDLSNMLVHNSPKR